MRDEGAEMLNKEFFSSLRTRGEELGEQIILWRRILHEIPELRMDTPKTEAEIVRVLREIGIEDVKGGVGGHGVVAVIRGGMPGGCLAIRADCDGLPIKEETGLPFASKNGNMHACGHDAHTAMALGAAKLIYENRKNLCGSVKLIFQPYEEGDGGAKLMIADGVLKSPKVDAIVALHNHPTPYKDCKAGDVLITSEAITANIYSYEAHFHGTPAHVCLSATAKNPIYMAARAVSEIAALAKETRDAVCAVTVIDGGVRNNVIPEACSVFGTIRTFQREVQEDIKKKVFKILHDAADCFGGEVNIKTTIDLMDTKIDSELYERFVKTAQSVYPEHKRINLSERDMIGEDLARYADIVPAMYFKLSTMPDDAPYPLHHPRFDVNESALHVGSVLFAAFAFSWQE